MNTEKEFDVVIIGAGTAGITARKEVSKVTDNYLVVHDGPLGTTCARVGCMPSKALIQVANDIHRIRNLSNKGLISDSIEKIDIKAIFGHVRSLRNRFVKGIITDIEKWKDKMLLGRARFVDEQSIEVNGNTIRSKNFVIATGSSPVIPEEWKPYSKYIITTENIFEQETLPQKILIVGLGVIGLELGQALSRLGLDITALNRSENIAGLTDPKIKNYVLAQLKNEFRVIIGEAIPSEEKDDKIVVIVEGKPEVFDKIILSVGRKPNTTDLRLNKTGACLNENGMPEFDHHNLSIQDRPHLFLAGDVDSDKPVLHEAADDGKIAGYNSVNPTRCFKRRVSLGIVFSDPNIAMVGDSYKSLKDSNKNFVIGEVNFEGQGRAITQFKNQGLLHVYVNRDDGLILGAEFQCPDGEHIAHLLAWAISKKMTVTDALRMPFYHPVIEEGLRTALRNAAKQITQSRDELFFCDDPPIR